MQIEFNYYAERWYLDWLQDWQESLAYAFKKMQERFDHDAWWSYGNV